MSSDDSGFQTVSTVLAVLLAVPLVMIGVAMPLMTFTKGGHMMGGNTSWQMFMPLIPFAILGTIAYILYDTGGGNENRQKADTPLEELKSAYARGELSDEEFENRRDRLQSDTTHRSEVSRHE